MRVSAVARRYARALFSIAQEEGSAEAVRRELDGLLRLLDENRGLHDAIFRPLHPASERRAVLRAVCERLGTSKLLRNFCAFLIDQRRVVELDAIRQAYGQLADLEAGRTRARVVSATPLDDAQRSRLQRALSERTGKQVQLEERVDPKLIGGAVASVGGLLFDGSLRTQLEQLRTSLTRG